MASNRNIPNATFNRLDVIKDKINTIQNKIDDNSNKIDENTNKIDENSNKIDENSNKINENSNKIDENSNKIDEIELELNNVSKSVEILFTRLYENNNKIDSDDTVSGIYLNGAFIISPSGVFKYTIIIIKNIKRSRDQNKDIYDIYEINTIENKLQLNLTTELITDENGVKSFSYLNVKYVFIREDLAINIVEDSKTNFAVPFYFKKIYKPDQEVSKFLNQYKNTIEEYSTKKNIQIESDLSNSEIWKHFTENGYGTNNIDNEFVNIMTGERIKTNRKKLTSTELTSLRDRLYYNDENYDYPVKNIKQYKTFGECKGRLIQNTIEFNGDYDSYFTVNEFSQCNYLDVTVSGSINNEFNNRYENFTYKVSCYDRCPSQPFKDFRTSNIFNLRVPILLEIDSIIIITFNFSDSYENGFHNTVTINFKRGLYYTEDICDTINYNIRFKTNASAMMYLSSPSRYTDLKNNEEFQNINSSHYCLAQTNKKGIIRSNSVSISCTGDIGKIMDIIDGNYEFEKINDNISTISFGDNPITFTSVENMNFECNDNSKIVHMRKKVNGSNNPNIFIDNFIVWKIFLKWEHHNLTVFKIRTQEFMEVSVPNNYPDYKSSVEYELTEIFRWLTTGSPILFGMNRDLSKDSNLSFVKYARCGLTGQNCAGIYGYELGKQISDKENDTLKNYFKDLDKITKDENGNIIVKNYYDITENDVEVCDGGHYIGVINPEKQPDGYKDVIIGVLSLRTFIFQNINNVKEDFFQVVIKYFNSKNVSIVIYDLGFNPGGSVHNSFITMMKGLRTDLSWKNMSGTIGNKDNLTYYLGDGDVLKYMNDLPEDEKNNYIKAGFNYGIIKKYTYTDEDGDIFEKTLEYEEELNATRIVVFLNSASFSGAQYLANLCKSKSKFNTKQICRVVGATSSIFATSGTNQYFSNYNENIYQYALRYEALTSTYGKGTITPDDYSNFYNRFDSKYYVTNDQYLKDFNVDDDGVKDNDKDHKSSEYDIMINEALGIN